MNTNISVVGAGKMGLSIAQFFAQNKKIVQLIDLNKEIAENAKENIVANLKHLENLNLLDENSTEIINRISISSNLEDAQKSEIVFEAVPENLEIKTSLFLSLEKICNEDTIFATNTSGISINLIAESLSYPERFLGTHFFMPAETIPLVEVVKGDKTKDDIAKNIVELLNSYGKKAVLIHKDIPGFIANRIQHAMAREAISLLESGVASAEDIDTVVKWSLGVRMVHTGPIEQRDFNGIDIHTDIASYLYQDLENRTTPSPILLEKVEKGELGLKTNKGFYDWDEATKREKVQKKNDALLKIIKYLEEEN